MLYRMYYRYFFYNSPPLGGLYETKKLDKSINRINLYGKIKWGEFSSFTKGGGVIEEITVNNCDHRYL